MISVKTGQRSSNHPFAQIFHEDQKILVTLLNFGEESHARSPYFPQVRWKDWPQRSSSGFGTYLTSLACFAMFYPGINVLLNHRPPIHLVCLVHCFDNPEMPTKTPIISLSQDRRDREARYFRNRNIIHFSC